MKELFVYNLSRLPVKFYSIANNNSLTIQQKTPQFLLIEIFKVKMNISPKIMNEIFYFSKNFAYELRSGNCLAR